MITAIKNMLIGLVGSKKVMMALAGLIVAFLAKHGFNVSDQVVLALLGFFASLILGQGVADHGKSAAQATAIAAIHTTPDLIAPSEQKAAIDAIKSV